MCPIFLDRCIERPNSQILPALKDLLRMFLTVVVSFLVSPKAGIIFACLYVFDRIDDVHDLCQLRLQNFCEKYFSNDR